MPHNQTWYRRAVRLWTVKTTILFCELQEFDLVVKFKFDDQQIVQEVKHTFTFDRSKGMSLFKWWQNMVEEEKARSDFKSEMAAVGRAIDEQLPLIRVPLIPVSRRVRDLVNS